MKRKDLEEDFSSHRFSRKSRRLDGDAELISAMEEDPEAVVAPLPEHQLVPVTSIVRSSFPVIDAPMPDERAFKLYNPSNSLFLRSPGSTEFPIIIDSKLIPGLKDRLIWPENSEPASVENPGKSDDRLAVIPWTAQSHSPPDASKAFFSNHIDSEDADMDMMVMEYSTDTNSNSNIVQCGERIGLGEGFQPWQQQQQHPYFPVPQNIPAAPITW